MNGKQRSRLLWAAWVVAFALAVSAAWVIWSGEEEAAQTTAALPPKGYIALTFDDGPWPKTTEALLDGLAQRGVKATFFLVGEQVADHPDTVKRMEDEGHQIGLHTWHHVPLKGMTREEICAQLNKTRQTLQALVGPEDFMLRPPYGFVDETLEHWAQAPIICWSVDTEDWKSKDADKILDIIYRQVSDGDIVLLHDRYQNTVDAVLRAVPHLQEQGYVFVTVSELLTLKGVTPESGVTYHSVK